MENGLQFAIYFSSQSWFQPVRVLAGLKVFWDGVRYNKLLVETDIMGTSKLFLKNIILHVYLFPVIVSSICEKKHAFSLNNFTMTSPDEINSEK